METGRADIKAFLLLGAVLAVSFSFSFCSKGPQVPVGEFAVKARRGEVAARDKAATATGKEFEKARKELEIAEALRKMGDDLEREQRLRK